MGNTVTNQPDIKIPKPKVVDTYKVLVYEEGTGQNLLIRRTLQNEIGNIAWTRVAAGRYKGTLTGAFPEFGTIMPPYSNTGMTVIPFFQTTTADYYYQVYRANDNEIWLEIFKTSDQSQVDLFTVTGASPVLIWIERYN